MALSPADIDSFIAALHEDPALRDRVRGALLSDEFLAMPASIRELDERMARQHAEHMARMDALDERIRELDRAFRERVDAFEKRQEAFEKRMDVFDQRMQRIDGRLGNLEGWQFEARYRDRLTSHLARRVRKARVISPTDLDAVFDAFRSGNLPEDEWDDLHRLDILVVGSDAAEPGERIFAIELSMTVDTSDVTRAKRRADILRRFEIDAEPMVDGDHILREARILADQLGVTVLVRDSATTDAA